MRFFETFSHLFHPRRSNNHRPKLLHPEALAFLPLLVIGFFILVRSASFLAPLTGSILGYASNISVDQVISMSNEQRRQGGLADLAFDGRLAQAAQGKASDMFQNQYWAHTSPTGKEPWDFIQASGYSYQVAGENLARDFMTTSDMTAAWMSSPTHRANIMNSRYSQIGVAVVNGVLNGTETTLVVQMFGSPAGAVASVPEITEQAVETAPAPTSPPAPTSQPVIGESTPEENELVVIEAPPTVDQNVAGESDPQPAVLARFLVPEGELIPTIIMSPLQLLRAFFLAVVILVVAVLIYDLAVIGHRVNTRAVGKNLAHIILLLAVAFLITFFRGGVIG